MKRLLTTLSLVLLVSYSYSQEVFTGSFLIRDGILYHQDTNEPVTGIVETSRPPFFTARTTYRDGKLDGLFEWFHDNGQLSERRNYKDGVLQK